MSISLPALFSRGLQDASKAFNQSAFEQSTQDLIQSSLVDLKSLSARIVGLSLFSPNEILEDISTRDLMYLLVPYALAEVQGRVRSEGPDERIAFLVQSQKYLNTFISNLENYEIVPENERTLHAQDPAKIKDASSRRDLKIKQYQREKDLRARIETIRKRRGQLPVDGETEFDLISSLLPKKLEGGAEEEEEDEESDDILRETILLLLRLCYAQAASQLLSLAQELELLQNAPRMPPPPPSRPENDRRGKERAAEGDMWKLDAPSPRGGPDGKGPLLDPSGKPLRPFTILPSGSSDRARLAAQVFGPGYRLPTMSIDEYLQIEQERGNILTGGGPGSENALTESEQLALDAEMDGSKDGAEKEEMKRLKDENWAQFTDENPRGAGNTMNRG
ncbi:Serine/threonine protein phosphatase PP2A-associated protein [Mycena sanguinolenta]|uniref:Serine/threonine protein phosphatase PP2A-associated protein n=1 Tax=Mycena sanguinolenta TaxID=230812 RepID=A0A8H7D730_9AGAR|nr:Serine/threonine protein phosphatase PP2A-associated protein [Mycena sanguinolenta]